MLVRVTAPVVSAAVVAITATSSLCLLEHQYYTPNRLIDQFSPFTGKSQDAAD
jgi:hypothetical protein